MMSLPVWRLSLHCYEPNIAPCARSLSRWNRLRVRLTVRTQGSRGVHAAWKTTVFLVSYGFTLDGTSAHDVPAGVEALGALLRA